MGTGIRSIFVALGKLSLGEWIALYGAGLSTYLGLREWRRRSRVHVHIGVGERIAVAPGQFGPRARVLWVKVVNRSDYAVRVETIWLRVRGRNFTPLPLFSKLTAAVQPHDAFEAEMPVESALDHPEFRGRRVRAVVGLSTGEFYRSAAFRLRADLAEYERF